LMLNLFSHLRATVLHLKFGRLTRRKVGQQWLEDQQPSSKR
jgi:hypothetical protein